MELKDLTPAQTLMITKPFRSNGRELMKYSFLDLVYRGILKVYKDWRLPNPRDSRERLYTFVSRGNNFTNHIDSYHQSPFLYPFEKDDYEYQVRILVKKVFKEFRRFSVYKREWVYEELKAAAHFNSSMGLKYFGGFFLSKQGVELKRKFKNTLNEAELLLPGYAYTDQEKTSEILQELGSNVMLLECFDNDMIKQLKPLFEREAGGYNGTIDMAYTGYDDTFKALFYSFLDTMDYFDSSFESFDTNFDFGGSDFGGGDFDVGDFGGDW